MGREDLTSDALKASPDQMPLHSLQGLVGPIRRIIIQLAGNDLDVKNRGESVGFILKVLDLFVEHAANVRTRLSEWDFVLVRDWVVCAKPTPR